MNKNTIWHPFIVSVVSVSLFVFPEHVSSEERILVFSKTAGFRHGSIADGRSALSEIAVARNWQVTFTEDGADFTTTNLATFDVVVWLLTSGDVLNAKGQAAFERYIQGGGGYVGIHSASDTEYEWPWYGELVGAYFRDHPRIQLATLTVEDHTHPATTGLPTRWMRTDEWYNFRKNPRSDVNVLIALDESTYDSGDNPMGDHPIAWYHKFDGGRAFYTALGHTSESYQEELFRDHLAGAIAWAANADQSPCNDGDNADENTRPKKPVVHIRGKRASIELESWCGVATYRTVVRGRTSRTRRRRVLRSETPDARRRFRVGRWRVRYRLRLSDGGFSMFSRWTSFVIGMGRMRITFKTDISSI